MLFTSAAFLVLLAAAVALHWALPWQRARLALHIASGRRRHGEWGDE